MPAESLTKTALRNATPDDDLVAATQSADYGAWSQTDMLLADIADRLAWLLWAKTKDAETGKNPPKPYPRPGVKREGVVDAKVINLLDYMRDHHGAAPAGYGPTSVSTI